MARKAKARSRKAKIEITPSDYRYPGESGVYWTGVAGIFILFIWIIAMLFFFARQPSGLIRWQWIYLFIWPMASIFIANYLSAKPRLAQIKQLGPQSRVRNNNREELFELLTSQCATLGLTKIPSLYVVEDDMAYIYAIPGKPGGVIASSKLVKELSLDEFGALLARELGSLRAHSVRVGLAITWIRSANPLIKILLLPLYLMSVFMRGWVDLSELSADHVAVLVTGQESLVNLAVVKLTILQDPQSEISRDDLAAFISGSSDISTDSAQVDRSMRLGKFLGENEDLKERIDEIRNYRGSRQGQAAFAKLAQLRGGGNGGG